MLQPLPGEMGTPLEPKYRVTMLGKRAQPAADTNAVAALEEAASAARLFGQVEAAVAGTSSGDTLQDGLEPGKQPLVSHALRPYFTLTANHNPCPLQASSLFTCPLTVWMVPA